MPDNTEFQFNPAGLATPRKLGISAYMRIKNEAQFVRLAIKSHLPFYDEIIAVYNDCTDNTENILLDLQAKHPDKIKAFHYLPKVHPICTQEHKETPTESVHSIANYCNYALSKCAYSVATKLDADHLSIPKNLARLVQTIRADIKAGKQKFYYFSGINLVQHEQMIMCACSESHNFSGNGDIAYHPVAEKYQFRQGITNEKFNKPKKTEAEYMGIMYFHLNALKTDLQHNSWITKMSSFYALPLAEFATKPNFTRLKKALQYKDRLRYVWYSPAIIRKLKYQLMRQHIHLRPMRLLRLKDDLREIDFQRDVVDKLRGLV